MTKINLKEKHVEIISDISLKGGDHVSSFFEGGGEGVFSCFSKLFCHFD